MPLKEVPLKEVLPKKVGPLMSLCAHGANVLCGYMLIRVICAMLGAFLFQCVLFQCVLFLKEVTVTEC